MKIFISQPMSGLTEKQIRRNRSLAVNRLYRHMRQMPDTWPKEWQNPDSWMVIDNFQFDKEPHPLCYMANDIRAMSEANLIYFINGWQLARGCKVEHFIAKAYGFYIIEEYDHFVQFYDPDLTMTRIASK